MAVNAATLALIMEHEGLRTEAYPDPAHGWAVPTIGYGHTSMAGPPKVYMGLRITKEEAKAILARDLEAVEAQVRKAVKVPLNDNQLGALVSFTFNLGIANLNKSTLLKKLNTGDYTGASGEFGKWVYAGGKKLRGLVRRREDERKLFVTAAGASKPAPSPAPKPADKPKTNPAIGVGILAVLAAIYTILKAIGVPLP